jgi:hypothetical protein
MIGGQEFACGRNLLRPVVSAAGAPPCCRSADAAWRGCRSRPRLHYDYADIGFQPIYLVFPTPVAGDIGRVVDASLTSVTLVEKKGEGPSWKFKGLERGWRVTQ